MRGQEAAQRGYGHGLAWAILLIVIVPNLLFVGLAWFSGSGRTFLNLDYAVPAFLVALGFRWFGVLVLLFFLLVDLLILVGQLFPFIRILDLLYLAKFTFFSSASYQFAILFISCSLIIKCWIFWGVGRRVSREGVLVVFNVMIFGYAIKVYGGEESGDDRFWRVSDEPLISSQMVNFFDYRSQSLLDRFEMDGEPFSTLSDSSAAVYRWHRRIAEKSFQDKALLVVNESWGVPRDSSVQDALLQPLRAVARGQLEQGHLPFVGATVAGELRELCRLSPNHYNLSPVKVGFEGCLPNILRSQGYKTASVHGAVSLMYDRKYWYPRVGFEESTFFESKIWPSRCYSFPGACDLDLLETVGDFLRKDGKRFLYWLTLNSHSIYDQRDIRMDVFDCESFSIDSDSRECRNLKLQAQFFLGLGELLRSDEFRGVNVMVVGDHEPPIVNSDGKLSLFEEGQVPWVSFVVDF